MMKITTLKDAPHLYSATISLIERSFEYKKPFKFEIDFAPLVDQSNFANCFIMVDENESVVAHIGVCERNILGFNMAMLGGIAVDEARRGEGFFQELIQDVLAEKRSEVAFFLLWSDQEKLYKKYGFYLCGTQIEIPENTNAKTFQQTKLHALNEKQKKEIQAIFEKSFATTYTTVERTQDDWTLLEKVTSADLFYEEENGKITSYFIMNKGQDLTGVIYEYGTLNDIKALIPKMSAYGKVWLGSNFIQSEDMQYQFFMGLGDSRMFSDFVRVFTKEKMLIHEINLMKQEVYFYFNDELLSLEVEDFLRGILGPGIFEEIEDDIRPLFISGLVSI
jgi:predicted N-acetyltransferase YhbS